MRALARSIVAWIVCVCCLSSAVVALGASTTQPVLELPEGHDHEAIPLSRAGAWLVVPVSINGKDAGLFMVDTGATTSMIDEDAARKLGLTSPTTRGRVTSGSHATVSSKVYRIDSLSVGGATTMRNIVIGGVAMRAFGALSGVSLVGVIGGDVLRAIPFTLDYSKPTLTFHRRAAFTPPATTQPFAIEMDKGTPLVRAQIHGRDGWFELDTGSSGRLDIEAPFVAFNRDALRDLVMVPTISWDVAGRVEGFVTFVRSIRFLGHEQSHVRANVTMGHYDINVNVVLPAGKIGGRLLDDVRLTLDYDGKQAWAEWPERLSAEAMARHMKEIAAGDLSGGPAVLWATSSRRTDALELLLKEGADANAADKSGFTALMYADADAVKVLLAHGADPNAQAAVQGISPLSSRAENGDAEGVKQLLAAGAKPDVRQTTGETPLLLAAQAKCVEAVKALIEAGANVNAADKGDQTPLIAAAWQESEPIVALLLEHGADPDRRAKDGTSALMLAAKSGSADVVKQLLAHGARANLPYEKHSALHDAVRSNDGEIVKLLLDAGATRDAPDEEGLTPEQVGYTRSRNFALRVLMENPTTPQTQQTQSK